MFLEFVHEFGRRLDAFLHGHKRRDPLSFDLVRPADDSRLGHFRMVDERALDLHRPNTMSGDIQDVVDTPEQPIVAVGIHTRAVAREVDAVFPLAPVLRDETLWIAI